MEDKSTIDFEGISDERQLNAVRKSFRVPVEDGSIHAEINGKTFSVADISPAGVCITVEKGSIFTVSQEFKNCTLTYPGGQVTGLTAKVVHLTGTSAAGWKNGIQWLDMTDENLKKTGALVSDLKKKLLEDPKDL